MLSTGFWDYPFPQMATLNFDEPDLTFIHSLQEDGCLTAKQMQSILEVVKARLDIEGDF